ncbi:hypothetical protein [uncultured Arthrobacter sp.]|uniref:hypothetical protein n=1 Tax=uncultured Arthrobacter sp. TaxID=114050 RepID=UPI00261C6828|nr:hypothetical protein [uncultured Arthrobacter sp.]
MGDLLDRQQRRVMPIVLVGVLVTAAYAWAGAMQILVWNPMAAVPGMTLDEIKAAMLAANEPLAEAHVYVWAAIGFSLALAVGIYGVLKVPDRPWTIARWFLVILVLGTPTYFFASFNPGMSIADAFATSGGDHAPWSRILYGISLLALITLMLTVTRRDNAQPKG